MKRKGFLRILSILAALMLLPVGALATDAEQEMVSQAYEAGKEVVVTLSFTPGAALGTEAVVDDLCQAAALQVSTMNNGYGALSLLLSGTDVFSAKLRMETDGLYVQSEILGDKPLYFTWDDLTTLMGQMMEDNGSSDEEIAAMSESFLQSIRQITAMSDMTTMTDKKDMTEEEMKQKIVEAMGGDDSFVQWINGIEAKQVITKGEFTLGDSDTADTKTEMTITVEDMNAMLDTQYVKDQITKQLKAEDSTLTDDELAAETESAIAEAKDEMAKTGMNMPVTVYTVGEDEDFIAMEIGLTGTFTDDEISTEELLATDVSDTAKEDETFKLDMTAKILKKTSGENTLYTLSATATKDDSSTVTMDGTLNLNDTACTGALSLLDKDGKPALTLAMTGDYADPYHITGGLEGTVVVEEEQTAFMATLDKTTTDTTSDVDLSLYTGASLDAVKADTTSALLGTIHKNVVVQDAGETFVDLAAATPDTALQIMQMSDDDRADYEATLETNYMNVFYAIFTNLPDSVSQALTSEMSE